MQQSLLWKTNIFSKKETICTRMLYEAVYRNSSSFLSKTFAHFVS